MKINYNNQGLIELRREAPESEEATHHRGFKKQIRNRSKSANQGYKKIEVKELD